MLEWNANACARQRPGIRSGDPQCPAKQGKTGAPAAPPLYHRRARVKVAAWLTTLTRCIITSASCARTRWKAASASTGSRRHVAGASIWRGLLPCWRWKWTAGGSRPAAGGTPRPADYVKLRAAVTLGWRVLRFTSGEVTSDPQSCIDEVVTNLEQTLDKPDNVLLFMH